MASSLSLLPLLITLLFSLLISSHPAISCYNSIFSFGDSLADTGNFLLSLGGKPNNINRLPYGETYFHRPTGRFSDGRVVVDFIAEAMGLPLLPPFLGGSSGQDFRHGVNFAVGGATALDSGFFREKGLNVTWTSYSLGVQIEWFKQLLPTLRASDSDCKDILSKSLFLVGEIGGNDYNHPFFQGRTLDEIQTFVPTVIDAISSAINDLIDLGARTLVVPGNFPVGCISAYLTNFQTSREEDYDLQTGCIRWLNEFAEYHNRKLLRELDAIRERCPYATIIYADNYNVAMSIFSSPQNFGFRSKPLQACCGGGGAYNYNSSVVCGNEKARVCDDPSRYVCWDGIHLTEAAYSTIANGLLNGPFAVPPINHTCLRIKRKVDQTQRALYSL